MKKLILVLITFVSVNVILTQQTRSKGVISNKIEHLGMILEYKIEGDFIYNSSRSLISCVPGGTISITGMFYNGVTVGNKRRSNFVYPKDIYVQESGNNIGFIGASTERIEVAHGASRSFNQTIRLPQSARGRTTIQISGIPFWIDRHTRDINTVPHAGQIRSTRYNIEILESLREDECIPSGVSFSDIYGEVYVIPANDPNDFYFAELDAQLCVGDIVEVRAEGGAILSLRDMTTFVMRNNSSVRIGDLENDSSNKWLLLGHIYTNVKRMLEDGSMDIEMSQAVAGIRGTSFFVSDDGTTSTVKVVNGSVEVTPKVGRPAILNSNEAISVRNRQAGNKTKFDPKQEFNKFDNIQKQWIQKDMGANFATLLGWKSHTIGNVSFAIPPSWKHNVFGEGNQRIDIFWIGSSLDNPTFGLSVETVSDYNDENTFFNNQGYSSVRISGKPVKEIANNELIYMLFPRIGNSNRGVVFNFMSGQKNGFNNMDDIISTISIK